MPDPSNLYETQVSWRAALTTPLTGTARIYLGHADEAGLRLRKVVVIPSTAVAYSGTNYITFRPFITTVKDGTPTVRYLGVGRSTAATTLLVDVPYRVHDEENFNERLVKGAMVGVDLIVSGTMPASVRATLQAGLNRG